jgi:outer membrane protein TolC
MTTYRKTYLCAVLFTACCLPAAVCGQQPLLLTLERTIELAADSSLEVFRSRNMYLAGYWEYRTWQAERLPALSLNLTPAQYYRDITRRYDSTDDIDVYRRQQYYYAYGGLSVTQNFDLTGGSFFLDTDLGYMRNFGDNTYSQYTTVPVRIGYSQDLLGYNPFKWKRKTEPLKFEKAKKSLLRDLENVSEETTRYFFELAMAQAEYDLAKDNVSSSDTLYKTGLQRHKIASVTQADLLTLKLDAVNAKNTLQNKENALKRAMFNLASWLNFDKNTEIRLRLPGKPAHMEISVDDALLYARENNPDFLELRRKILEAEQGVDKAKKEALFNASVRASIGFNQVANSFRDAYRNPLQQDIVTISVSVPIIDWGIRKGRYNVAKNTLNVTQISARQSELTIEEDVIMTVSEFNIQQSLIVSAEEASDLAQMAYAETKQRFMIGKADINSLTLSLNRQQEAQRNYISALSDYWVKYYKIRKLTLHDFETGISISDLFDYKYGL